MRAAALTVMLLGLSPVARAYFPGLLREVLLTPQLMGEPQLAEDFADMGETWPWQGTAIRTSAPATAVTAVCWLNLEGASAYWVTAPHAFPQEVFGRATAETYFGPKSGSGNMTAPGAVSLPETQGGSRIEAVAYSVTLSEAGTLSFGGESIALEPDAHLNKLTAEASEGADIVLETSGTWTLEVARPKTVRCFSMAVSEVAVSESASGPVVPPHVLADQWCFIAAEIRVDGSSMTVSQTTYYPDGCAEPDSVTVRQTECPWGVIPAGTVLTPFAVSLPKETATVRLYAYGLKAWHGTKTAEEIARILGLDAREMLRRGILTESDLHPGHEGTQTVAARALAAPAAMLTADTPEATHGHFPGLAPRLPDIGEPAQ